MAVTIAKESPVGADLTLLFTRHTADMHADTPPESIHMMDASELAIPAVQFFVAREAGNPWRWEPSKCSPIQPMPRSSRCMS